MYMYICIYINTCTYTRTCICAYSTHTTKRSLYWNAICKGLTFHNLVFCRDSMKCWNSADNQSPQKNKHVTEVQVGSTQLD